MHSLINPRVVTEPPPWVEQLDNGQGQISDLMESEGDIVFVSAYKVWDSKELVVLHTEFLHNDHRVDRNDGQVDDQVVNKGHCDKNFKISSVFLGNFVLFELLDDGLKLGSKGKVQCVVKECPSEGDKSDELSVFHPALVLKDEQ